MIKLTKKSDEQFRNELYEINKDLIPLEPYINSKEKIKIKCICCGNVFSSSPSNLLASHGCSICARKSRHDTQCMTKNIFKSRLDKIQPNLVLLSDYYNSYTKVRVRCKICGNEYNAFPNNLLRNYGCKQCYRNNHKPRSRDEFIGRVNEINDAFYIGEDYINGKELCSITCKICGYERSVIPNLFLSRGCRCPKCDGNIKITPNEYRDFVYNKNKDIIVVSDYITVKDKLLYKCDICGKRWNETPEVFRARDFRCKFCQRQYSKLEYEIQNNLIKFGVDFEEQKTFDNLLGVGNRKLSYDFFVPSKNLLIEAQGLQHYKPIKYFGGEKKFKIQKEHDSRKRTFAKNNGFDLIEISQKDYNRIPEILNENIS